jgi:hypothetical protein
MSQVKTGQRAPGCDILLDNRPGGAYFRSGELGTGRVTIFPIKVDMIHNCLSEHIRSGVEAWIRTCLTTAGT